MPEPRERKDALVSEDEVAARAYRKWKERGCPVGDATRDWYAALAELDVERDRHAYEAVIALYD
jgi:hypothetical protein